MNDKPPYEMLFDIGTIKHLGIQMYSTLPPVIGELIANAWDANATIVEVQIPTRAVRENESEIIVIDNGIGMTDSDVRHAYLRVGRDRRLEDDADKSPAPFFRPIMGRKGIGKFSGFGIAEEIEVESANDEGTSRFKMNLRNLEDVASERRILLPPLSPTGTVFKGTKVTLRGITKFKNRKISIDVIRRGLARRFSVLGDQHNFQVVVNGTPITAEERDLKRLLEKDTDGRPYLWEYFEEEVDPGSGWMVSGWIGALGTTASKLPEGDQAGIIIMARGKLVQEPFFFGATAGQQYALSYIVGEIHAEFVDAEEDTIGTTRNTLVWDAEPNAALMMWGRHEVNRITREWAKMRQEDNDRRLSSNPLYVEFRRQAEQLDNKRALRLADQLVREVVRNNPLAGDEELEPVIRTSLDFLEFDAFWELADDITKSDIRDPAQLIHLFREWEIVEAKEMARVVTGRVATIKKLQSLINENALEVPTLHNFLKEFPWVIDPRWNLIADEFKYSQLLKDMFPEPGDLDENDRRIDFLCVREGTHLVIVEIKRPQSRVSEKELDQIEKYVNFMRHYTSKSTDEFYGSKQVVGYLLCGDLVDTYNVKGRLNNLARSEIYVRLYRDMLAMVEKSHREFLERYDSLRKARERSFPNLAG